MIKNISIFFLLIAMSGCREKIDFIIEDSGDKQLVVEGNITDREGPYYVYLSHASPDVVNENQRVQKDPVSSAKVIIVHVATGNAEELFEIPEEKGTYASPENSTFRGEVENDYYLQIELGGETYQSSVEKINAPPPIDSIYTEFNNDSRMIEIYIDFTDPAATRDAYLWKWNAFKQIRTNLPDEPFVACCAICYVPFTGNEINVIEDINQNGRKIKKQKVASFFIFKQNTILVEVQQHKLGENAFSFWNLLQLQQESKGGLFDPPPFRISGNLRNINDEQETVLGYFYASGVSEIQLQFSGNRYALNPTPFENIDDDCRLIQLADTITPVNWRK